MSSFSKLGGGGQGLTVASESRDGAVIVTPTGDIDLSGSPTLRAELKKAQANMPAKLLINLANVPYMDSSGIATLVEALQLARKGNTAMVLCGLQDRVRSILEISRLNTVFTIADSAEAALR